jgi:hypothetical protein
LSLVFRPSGIGSAQNRSEDTVSCSLCCVYSVEGSESSTLNPKVSTSSRPQPTFKELQSSLFQQYSLATQINNSQVVYFWKLSPKLTYIQ